MSHLTFSEAMVVGLIQGVTELFPVSSLGHNVLIPALVGGSWAQDLNASIPSPRTWPSSSACTWPRRWR
jgi:undecaprenyl-diphosphatase